MSNDVSDISQTLEREILLRRFNREYLGMQELTGAPLQDLVGQGKRKISATGKLENVEDLVPSVITTVMTVFAEYPIQKYFGITIADAMNMPFDQWLSIKREAEKLPTNRQEDERQLINIKKMMDLSLAQVFMDNTGGS